LGFHLSPSHDDACKRMSVFSHTCRNSSFRRSLRPQPLAAYGLIH
jgi:hypothetical protein